MVEAFMQNELKFLAIRDQFVEGARAAA